jgi:hypothetical protein
VAVDLEEEEDSAAVAELADNLAHIFLQLQFVLRKEIQGLMVVNHYKILQHLYNNFHNHMYLLLEEILVFRNYLIVDK